MKYDFAGIESRNRFPDGLIELAPQIFEETGTAPYKCELPGSTSNILVSNLPKLDDSPFMNMLKWQRDLDRRNLEMFGCEKISVGSLNAQILTIYSALKEGIIDSEYISIVTDILSRMELAQKYDFVFHFWLLRIL